MPSASTPEALLVDDNQAELKGLAELVEREGYSVRTASTLEDARRQLGERIPDVVITDLMLPDGRGLDLRADPDTAVQTEMILVTGHATVDSAVQALRTGVLDYLTKPIDLPRLKTVLANVARTIQFKTEVSSLRGELRKLGRFGRMIGSSQPMQRVYDLIARAAPTEVTVLVTGESGTGKELVAETIHELSPRRRGPFLAINCGAVSPTLVESELFGHERGSFTGATQRHRGHFERASGGTLFLDEITEMPIELQVKLLRVLETGTVMRIGGQEPLASDVRVIAASNRIPSEVMAEGKLREDLYYRLNVFPVNLPPLRDREGDVALLCTSFLAALNEQHGGQKRVSPAVLERFERYPWPGNVRELRNVLQRAFIMAEEEIDASCLPPEVGVPTVAVTAPDAAPLLRVGTSLAEAERRLILATLAHYEGDKKKAAEALGISLKTLYNRLNLYRAA